MGSNPFEEWDDVLQADWDATEERAWQVFRKAEVGDEIIWGSRANPLTVNERNWTDGLVELEVEGPRGGTYTLRERYERGQPRHYADDSRANDLRFAEDDLSDGEMLSTDEYENLIVSLETQSLNTFSTDDYATYRDAVRAVVNSWSSGVQLGSWSGMETDEESSPVFKSVIEYSPHREDTYDTTRPLQWQAEEHLVDTIVNRSEQDADLSLVRDRPSYVEFVDEVASRAIDRLNTSRYQSASLAARDAASKAIEGHGDEFYRNIISHSEREPMEYDFYAEQDGENQYQEMAFDVLTDDVSERVREIRRDSGTHDPRPGGLRWSQYDDVVEDLVEQSIREHRINHPRYVEETVEDVVGHWTDTVVSGNFSIDGQDFGSRQAEDVFGSIVLHSKYEPSGFNPFSSSTMREAAFDVLVEDVSKRYKNAVEAEDAEPIPADAYLQDELGLDLTYADIREDSDLSTEDFIRETLQSYEGEWGTLAGWTFVDELVEAGNFNVPRFSTSWVLVDYGLVEEDSRLRRAAWFHRENGSVIGLTGSMTQAPKDGGYEPEEFGVYIMRWDAQEPEYLIQNVPIQEAMEFLYDRLGGNSADIRLVQTKEGEYWVQDTFDSGRVDSGTILGNLAPGIDVPGIGLVPESVRRRGGTAYENVTKVAREKIQLGDDMKRFAFLVFMEQIPYLSKKFLHGTEIRPTYNQKRGVGLEIMNTIGAEADENGVGGNVQGQIYIRPQTLRTARDRVFQDMWSAGDSTVDISYFEEKVNNIIEFADSRTSQSRSQYLMLFLPRRPRGAPQGKLKAMSRKYFAETNEGYGESAYYTLMPGEELDESQIRERVEFAREHGVGKIFLDEEKWGEKETGHNLIGFEQVKAARDSNDNVDIMLPKEQAEEIGWSLTAKMAGNIFGPEDRVGEGTFSGSYEDFLDLYEHFSYVPEKSVVGQGFRWLIEEGRSSEKFTMADVYHAFRTSLVFDKQEKERDRVFAELIENGTIPPEMIFQGSVSETGSMYRASGMANGGVQFVWDFPRHSEFAQVFDGKDLGDVEQILMASGRGGYGATNYYVDEGEDRKYSKYQNNLNKGRETDYEEDDLVRYSGGVEDGPARTKVTINSADELWEYASREARNLVISQLQDEGFAEDVTNDEDGEAFAKWLDGTSLDVSGLFLSGLGAATGIGSNKGSFMGSRDIFPLKLNDIPGVNFDPERPDIPSFEEWRRTRRGLASSESSKSQERGRYLREISDFVTPNFRQLAGFDEEAEFEAQADRQAAMADGDYENYEHYYADEFGESFEDVEARFNAGNPVDDDGEISERTPEIDED